jgi:putative ABC transport system permease protein
MFSMVTGKAACIVSGECEAPLAESLQAKVEAVPGVKAAVPVISKLAVLHAGGERVALQLLGVDLQRDSAVRDYVLQAGRPLQGGKELLLDYSYARRLKLQVGDTVRLLTNRGLKEIKVVGFLQLRGASALQNAGLCLIPIETAQQWFASKGKITSLQIVVDDQADAAAVQKRIAAMLPTGVQVHPPAMRTQGMEETMYGSEIGLQMTTACTLLLSFFIILNTFMMNVSERRRQLSILRAIGATGRQVTKSVEREALLLGLVGTALGIGVGVLAAYFLNRSLSSLLDVPLPTMRVSALPLVLAVVFGLGVSLAGARVPARRAGKVSPLEGMDRVSREDLGGVPRIYIHLGAVLTLASATLITLSIRGFLPMDVAIFSGTFLFIGIVSLFPLVLAPFCRAAVFLLRPWSRVESGLALRQVLRHHGRSTLTVGVLFVAGAGGVGMAYSILDSVRDVQKWYRQAVVGDFYVRSMLPSIATSKSANLPDEIGAALRKVPHLTSLEGMSWVQGSVGDMSVLVLARDFSDPPLFDLVAGDRNAERLRQQLSAGQVVIGSVLAKRLSLGVGDPLELETQQGTTPFPICAVTNDYLGGGLTVYIHREVAVQRLGVEGFTLYVARAAREDLETVRQQLQSLCDDQGVLLHSNAEITVFIDELVLGIDGCLWGLIVLVFVVASFGVVNTLTMNVLEQTRELGVLRIVAMTKGQVRRTVLTQALIMGAVGFTPGVLEGVAFAWVINLGMPAVLGHQVEFGFHPWLVLLTLVAALAVTACAAWIPARRAANLDAATALHYE